MALTVKTAARIKGQTKAKPAAKISTLEIELIDELVTLHAELAAIDAQAKLKRVDDIKKLLQSTAADFDPLKEVTLEGTLGNVTFSPCRNDTVITDQPAIIKKLGQKTFNEIAKVGLGELRKYLSELELEQVTTTTAGARIVKKIEALPE